MKNEILQVIGRECKVFELQLPCECGGYFAADTQHPENHKYINGNFHVSHKCNKCNRQVYIEDVYPKIDYRPFGEFIRFGELGVKG